MTQAANTIKPVLNTVVTIGGIDYALHIPKVKWSKKESQPVTFQGGTVDAQYVGATPEQDHVAEIDLGHDYQNQESAYAFFRQHPNEDFVLAWKPEVDGPYTVTATITGVSPNPGGDYGKQHTSTIKCPSSKPVDSWDDAAAPVITGHLSDGTLAAAGGEQLILEGTDFASVTEVKFGATVVVFQYLGVYDGVGRILIPASPAHAAGVVAVTATNKTGTSAGHNVTYA